MSLIAFVISISLLYLPEYVATVNTRPIVGVLAQETGASLKHYGDTFIPASYVKYLESAGARVVPIRVKQPVEYYNILMDKINGVLFPGGGADILTSEYAKAAKVIYKLALQANDEDDYFPLWGTCLGFQLLTALTSGENLLSAVSGWDLALPLNLQPVYKKSKLFGNLSDDVFYAITKENVTQNFHHWSITPQNFSNNAALMKFYKVLSTNIGTNGKEFISTIEARNYPVYGVQWHPEKNNFLWNPKYHINHGHDAVRISQYFANFFVGEARKSNHQYPDNMSESKAMIENYQPVFFSDGSFDNLYFFNYTSMMPEIK